jgi:uncharacterized protein (TIGR03083 family)
VSAPRPSLRPEPAARGLASTDPGEVADLVRDAWAGVITLAGRLDLERPSRLPGWTVRDTLVHLGSWPEHTRFDRLVDDVRSGRRPDRPDPGEVDARNAMLVAAHRDADADQVVAALEQARDRALAFLTGPDAESLGRQDADSPVGPLPLTCVIAAGCYELAVHALDLTDADQVPLPLLNAGIGALVDTTGALAARSRVKTTFAVLTPTCGWACASVPDSWTTMRLDGGVPVGELGWPTLQGAAADVLDASAGRRPVVSLLLTRRLRLTDLAGLMTLLPALESVPGLPGGAALRATARTLGQTGRLVGRIGSAVRR